jgi:hypothetical protein
MTALRGNKEAVMCRTPLGRLSVSLLVLLVTGCAASSLQLSSPPQDPYLADLRAEFLKSHPDNPYCVQVSRGEVVAGMDMFGVLAAWGQPAGRAIQKGNFEQWVYFDVDEDSGDALEYSLSFVEGVLDAWRTRVHKSGGLPYRWETTPVSTLAPDPPPGKRVPTN